MSTRRLVLKTGGAAILLAAAGGGWWGATRTPTKALEPWAMASRGYGDVRLDALAHSVGKLPSDLAVFWSCSVWQRR